MARPKRTPKNLKKAIKQAKDVEKPPAFESLADRLRRLDGEDRPDSLALPPDSLV